MVSLPEWLLRELPEPQEPALLKYENNKYVAVSPDGNDEVSFSVVDEACDYIKERWQLEVEFDDTLIEHTNSRSEYHIWGKRTEHGIRMLNSRTDFRKLERLEREYEDFLDTADDYFNSPKDFETVYTFVNNHPAFWIRQSKEHPWFWDTTGHCALNGSNSLVLEPDFRSGKTIWTIETGRHAEPEYNERTYDYRLDSYGKTPEEAFIMLAKLINKFYNLDGTQKDNVPHEKPEWVKELENRVKDTKSK